MKKEFLFNILFLLAINLLIKPFYIFGIDRTVQNLTGKEAYGLYFALFNFTLLFQIVADLGTQNYNNRIISQHPYLAPKYFPAILTLRGALALLYMILVSGVAFFVYDSSHYQQLFWIALNQLLIAFILYLRSNIAGLALYRTDSVVSVIDKVLMISFCSILLWVEPFRSQFRIEWFIWCQTLTLSLTTLTALIILLRRTGRLRLHFRLPLWIVFIKKSLPFALVIFLMTLYSRIDAVMLERMIPDGPTQAGIYASAYRLLDASNMIGYLFASLLLPMFARLLKDREREGGSLELVDFSFKMIMSGAITAAITTFYYRRDIMALLYHGDPVFSGDVMGILMSSFIAMCTIYIYGTLLTAHGDLKRMNQLFAISIVLNIVLNLLLIPRYKALGAALATCFTQFFVAGLQWLLAHRLLKMKIRYGDLLRLLAFTVLLIFSVSWIGVFTVLSWTERWLLSLISGGLLAFATGLLSWQGVMGMLKRDG